MMDDADIDDHAGSDEDELMGNVLRRVSLKGAAQSRPSMLQVPDEALGAVFEYDDEEDDDDLDFEALTSGKSGQAGTAAAARELRQRAEQADANADRYATLIQHSANLVSEVKSALYDADHSGKAYGAEVLLDEVKAMLTEVSQKTLVEAAQLQKPAEKWLGLRKNLAQKLKANNEALSGLLHRRAELARASNEEHRADCDRLWKQIRDWELEIENMPKMQSLREDPLSPQSLKEKAASPKSQNPVELGGLTLEGAHSLLRAFAAVLQPHMDSIIPKNVDRRSPSEAVALEFLTACSESMQQMQPKGNNSPTSGKKAGFADEQGNVEGRRTLHSLLGESF